MGCHHLLAMTDPLADRERPYQTRDAGIDMHDGAAGKVDRAPQIDLAAVGQNLVELGLRRFFGHFAGCRGERLGGVGDGVGARPIPDHMRDREIDQGHP
jgi:hypothetical protein